MMNVKQINLIYNFCFQVICFKLIFNNIANDHNGLKLNANKLLKNLGYGALIRLQKPHEQNTTQQEVLSQVFPPQTMPKDDKETIKEITTKSISKNVPTLDEKSFELWQYQLMININCEAKDIGYILFQNPTKQKMDDSFSVTANSVSSSSITNYNNQVNRIKKMDGYRSAISCVHNGIFSTLSQTDKEKVMSIPFPSPVELMEKLVPCIVLIQ